MAKHNHDTVEALLRFCIRVDGVAFEVSEDGEAYWDMIEAAQCDGHEDAFTDDGELTLGPACLNRVFKLDTWTTPWGQPCGNYRCTVCDEPYTIRLLPL